MKKIIAMAVTAVLLLSATFALDFEVGARGILGRNLDSGSFADNYQSAKEDKTFDFSRFNIAITMLEIRGIVKREYGNQWILS